MHLPLVSIIIPVFNAERYIAETISSAINQTWENKEIIIVDDGSTDSSLNIASSFKAHNIKVLSQPNTGASAARNRGLLAAAGTFIQFLDADDLLNADKIEKQVKLFKGKEDQLSICPVVHFTGNSAGISKHKPAAYDLSFFYDSNDPFEFLMKLYGAEDNKGGMIPLHSWLSPAKLLQQAGKWNEKLTLNDDGEYFCRVVLRSSGILAAADTTCYYRKQKSDPSLSSIKDKASLKSQHHAILLKKEHLEKFKSDERINKVTSKGLMELLMIAYPAYKELSQLIVADLKRLGNLTDAPPVGGKIIELIKYVFGWKVARNIQYYYAFAFRNHLGGK